MKTISLNEYLIAGEEFWPKYWYVAKELGENALDFSKDFSWNKIVKKYIELI